MLNEELQAAIKANDLEACRQLIGAGADVNAEAEDDKETDDPWEMPPLRRAIYYKNIEICRLLIDGGADVNAPGEGGERPLYIAAGIGAAQICRLLIDTGADIHCRNENKETPLHAAVLDWHIAVCRLLISCGAHLFARDNDGNTPLHVAALNRDPEPCLYLLEAGAAIEAIDGNGKTALHRAAQFGLLNNCRALVGAGASPSFAPSAPQDNYLTPFQESVAQGYVKAARYFVFECGEDLAQKTLGGKALLDIIKPTMREQEMRQALLSWRTELAIQDAMGGKASDDAQNSKKSKGFGPL